MVLSSLPFHVFSKGLEGDALKPVSVNANIWFVSALFGYEV